MWHHVNILTCPCYNQPRWYCLELAWEAWQQMIEVPEHNKRELVLWMGEADFQFPKMFLSTSISSFSWRISASLHFKCVLQKEEPHLAHLSDGIIKDTACIISSFTKQVDFPGTRWKPQISWIEFHNLTSYLYQYWLCLLSSEHKIHTVSQY